MTKQSMWELTAAGTLAVALGAALLVPPEQTQGNVARMLFVHVPSIWLAYVAFGVTLVGSVAYLATRRLRWDRLAGASAEVGVFMTGAAIAMGMVWAKPIWGVYWTWDPRLVLTAVLFFVYLGYLALRRAIPDSLLRARRAALFGILAIVQIPIIHFSVVWWRTLHQRATLVRPDSLQMDPPFQAAMWMAVVAFTVLYAVLVGRRMQLSRLEERIDDLLAADDRALAGDAITAPRLDAALPVGVDDE